MRGSEQNERKTYLAGTTCIAMRENGTLKWLISDHLGSTSLTVDASGTLLSSLKYTAFGELRSGTASTDYRYTGQRQEAEIGLYFYMSRFFDPALGRFISPNTIVPGAGNPQAYDRYSYVFNNPVNGTDPTGHIACIDGEQCFKPYKPVTKSDPFSGYSKEERQVIQDLDNGGPNGHYAAQYIINNNVHIYENSYMFSGNGAQWNRNGNIYVNSMPSSSDYSYNYYLGLIAHEAKHLEQGRDIALSVYGEHEAWQIQFNVNYTLSPGRQPEDGPINLILNYPVSQDKETLMQIRLIMIAYVGIKYPIYLLPLNPDPKFALIV